MTFALVILAFLTCLNTSAVLFMLYLRGLEAKKSTTTKVQSNGTDVSYDDIQRNLRIATKKYEERISALAVH